MEISYAQNLEDILLHRALGDVNEGFYIDIGANDPLIDSVTKLFYEKGWSGINVEPMTSYYEKLCLDRPRDVNLNVAIGEEQSTQVLYEFPDTGLSTMVESVAQKHIEDGRSVVKKEIEVKPLYSALKEYLGSGSKDLHFLKIDVEGAEEIVLRGVDFSLVRPWVVVVEATVPTTQIESSLSWEKFLLDADYEFACFDGLNKYYVSKEKAVLKNRLKLPVNVFDEFIRYSEWKCQQDLLKTHELVLAIGKELKALKESKSYRYGQKLGSIFSIFGRS